MPGAAGQDGIPDFKKGDVLRASSLQAMADVLKRQGLAPGSFVSGAFTAQRRVLGGGNVTLAMGILTESIAPGELGGGTLFEGDVEDDNWKNISGVTYASGLTVGLVKFNDTGNIYIWPAFCPMPA